MTTTLVVLRDGEKVDLEDVSLPYQTYTGTDGQAYNGYGHLCWQRRVQATSGRRG